MLLTERQRNFLLSEKLKFLNKFFHERKVFEKYLDISLR